MKSKTSAKSAAKAKAVRKAPFDGPAYLNTSLSFEERAADLVSRMTLEEKPAQMASVSPAIERLGLPAYNWWNECLHGVGRAGIATVFPQAIAMAAMWDSDFLHRIAVAISDEARAKHHQAIREGKIGQWYFGLTFWTPNINIFRDPRWGRGHETYGEDPYLAGKLGVQFVKGLQGDDKKYLKLVATPKHFAVHSGPEAKRHGFDAVVSQRDLRESYLPQFKMTVLEADAYSFMGAYNRTNGEACCASITLLEKILRKEWGFKGFVVSDCGAICDIYKNHKLVETPEAAAALAVNNGCDLACDETYLALRKAVLEGLITEKAVNKSLTRLMVARMKLGMFDPPEMVPYASIPFEKNDCPERAMARKTACASTVLLKNDDVLPLPAGKYKSIAVVGPTADQVRVLLGNYNGEPSKAVTPLEGIVARAKADGANVKFAQGCHLFKEGREGFAEAVELAKSSDLVIAVMGLAPQLEGEEGEYEENRSGDRTIITLPGEQEELLKALAAAGKPVVLALTGGSPLAITWADENVSAILATWYAGEEGGNALADVLWGDYNPAGRLPVTFPKSIEQVPAFEDYNMKGRTYRFMEAKPLYPFGYGLSYTKFQYTNLKLSAAKLAAGKSVKVSVDVQNVGKREGDEVVQLYVRDLQASVPVPRLQLQGFKRMHLKAGKSATVTFTLTPTQMACWTDAGKEMVEPGHFQVSVGGGQPDYADTLKQTFEVIGKKLMLK